MNKKPLASKKFLLATVSLGLSFVVWLASYAGVLFHPEAAAHLVSLATLITGLLGTIAVAGITGQSFVDLKLAAFSSNHAESRNQEVNLRITEKPDPRVIEHFRERYMQDPSYRPLWPTMGDEESSAGGSKS